uniref:Uncharacterized protein n=1 Tax=Chinchilla lanigera TaxID=34839 RepID=A0A8C2VXE2_CHILA
MYVVPGETALAFYEAEKPTDKPVPVVPFEAGQYFSENPQEVDRPVFFYIDTEFAEDPRMVNVDFITLSYTFSEVKEGRPVPDYD